MARRPYINFDEVKRVIGLPEIIKVFGIEDQFTRKGEKWSGVCPLPQHHHGPSPNPDQFKMECKDNTWVFHCFGDCQSGGDVIEFVRRMTDYDHAHLRLWFAEHFGDRLTLTKPNSAISKENNKKAHENLGQVEQLQASSESISTVAETKPDLKPLSFSLRLDPDVSYLRQRGLTDETIQRYGLGLCRRGLLKDYVAIPVYGYPHADDSNPLAYLGRWPGDDHDEEHPRYKWPDGFRKSHIVYGLAEAMKSIQDGQPLVVVEGPFGVYHCVQAGFAAVAIFGSSMSIEQAELLCQTKHSILLLFDGDEAGRNGLLQSVEKLIDDTFVRVIKIPEGKQPDDLSSEQLQQMLE